MARFHVDRAMERVARRMARTTSRRSFIARIGGALLATPLFPLLPIDRARADGKKTSPTTFEKTAQTTDDTLCTYWRYCAIDGSLCSCAGGAVHSCPPGTAPGPVAWIGTCMNPDDKRTYLVSYNDCCGKLGASNCFCHSTVRETPVYRPQQSADVVWCFGTPSMSYHCTTAAIVGVAE